MMIVSMLIIILKEFKCQTCGVKDPNTFSDCSSDSSKNSICCYAGVRLLNSSQTLCVYVPKTQVFITPFVKSMDIGLSPDNIQIQLDCGFQAGDITDNEPYSICGINPQTEIDCFLKSTTTASCCYIENPDKTSVCLLNNGIYKTSETYFGIKVSCNSFTQNYTYIFLLFLAFVLVS